eukprot:GGOE01015667.1.p2 GENE.GGOE01015667.1~~GGOE01015667.1.p2  ORF type:complete len:101 (-),score=13.85 GGOE01015667.1:27-329(-)
MDHLKAGLSYTWHLIQLAPLAPVQLAFQKVWLNFWKRKKMQANATCIISPPLLTLCLQNENENFMKNAKNCFTAHCLSERAEMQKTLKAAAADSVEMVKA